MGEETPENQSEEEETEEIEEWELIEEPIDWSASEQQRKEAEEKEKKTVKIPATKKPQKEPEAKVKIHQLTECPYCKGDLGYNAEQKIYVCPSCPKIFREV